MYIWVIIFIILIFISIYLYDKPYLRKSELYLKYNTLEKKYKTREEKCREIFENYFQRKFPKVRHELLVNPKTNRKLELDCYSKNKFFNYYNGLAFEIDGEQHYNYIQKWHKTRSNFNEQIERDKLKNYLCEKNGILLIRIPYFINDIEGYMLKQINEKIFNKKI